MRVCLYLLTGLLASATASHAWDYQTEGGEKPGCESVRHVPNVGINAAGAEGVAPADLIPPALGTEDFAKVPLDITLPLENYANADDYNLTSPLAGVGAGQAEIDTVTGKTTFNGKDISSPDCAP